MKWMDYREKLGIGISDKSKAGLLANKIAAFVEFSQMNENYSDNDYYQFCLMTGIEYDDYANANYSLAEVFKKHRGSVEELLAYYIAYVNAMGRIDEYQRSKFIDELGEFLSDLGISYEVVCDRDGMFVFPKGAKELDDALVSQPLEWLESYPTAHRAFVKALQSYGTLTDENASDTADLFRKALEAFFHEFFNTEKSLDNCKTLYGDYLRSQGIPTELVKNFETLLQMYTNYMNAYAKHHDKAGKNALEYIMYQTGNIIRLLITLKQEESGNAH